MRRGTVLVVVGALIAAGSGCGSQDDLQSTSTTAAAEQPEPKVELRLKRVPKETEAELLVLRGAATPGALVTVKGKENVARGGTFKIKVPLKVGKNVFTIRVREPGFRPTKATVKVKRTEPPPPPTPEVTTAPETVVPPDGPCGLYMELDPATGACVPSGPSEVGVGEGGPCPPGQARNGVPPYQCIVNDP